MGFGRLFLFTRSPNITRPIKIIAAITGTSRLIVEGFGIIVGVGDGVLVNCIDTLCVLKCVVYHT